jgi:uncharacterized OB-fold protein
VILDTVTAYRCAKCGHRTFLRHTRCPKCRNAEFGEVPLGDGEVLTHTTLTATRPGFAKPLVLAIADFGNGVRILGQLDSSQPRVGMKVKTVIGKLGEKDGLPLRGLRFTPK